MLAGGCTPQSPRLAPPAYLNTPADQYPPSLGVATDPPSPPHPRQGDLELFTLAQDRIPCAWAEDPRWRGPKGAGGPRAGAAHGCKYVSRWVPAGDGRGLQGGGYYLGHGDDERCDVRVVDYLHVPRVRRPLHD